MKLAVIAVVLLFSQCGNPNNDKPQPNPDSTMIAAKDMIFKSGAFGMHKAGEIIQFEKNRNAEVSIITVFPSRETWDNLQSTWFMDSQRVPANFKGTLSIAMPMWPENGNLDDASNGNYNAQWEKFGKSVAAKYPDAYIRVGWEMNINDWHFKATPATADKWKTAFRLAVNNLRKGSPNFRIVFNPNIGAGQTGTEDATMFYPGDEYVDLIGVDAYDWWPGYTTEANIAQHRDEKYGWNWWLNFAKAHNKKFCLPEWGIATANPNSGGDNPMFINFVYAWLKENQAHIDMECYYQESADFIRADLFTGYNPKATVAYKNWMPKLKK